MASELRELVEYLRDHPDYEGIRRVLDSEEFADLDARLAEYLED